MTEDARKQLEQLIASNSEFSHLQVKKYGKSLVIHSGSGPDEQKHARFTNFTSTEWGVSLPHHNGRWEQTPFTGTLPELWDTLITNFPFYLEKY